MIQPKNIHDALRHMHNLLSCIGKDLDAFMNDDNPYVTYSPEYFDSIKDAVLDAHMLTTWIKDNLKGESK
jgi:hypothetical protein